MKILIYILIIFLTINTIIIIDYFYTKDNFSCEDCSTYNCESCMLYNPEVKTGVNGIYFTDKYFCVWLEGRNKVDINKTIYHEACHHLVYKDYDHFCIQNKTIVKINHDKIVWNTS